MKVLVRILVHVMNKTFSLQSLDHGSSAEMDTSVPELALMRLLEDHPDLTQRELAKALGLSLGKTHYLLHALLNKGLVKVRNFRRSDNKAGYAYLLTPSGIKEKLRLTRAFLVRKEAEFEEIKAVIAALQSELNQPGSGKPAS